MCPASVGAAALVGLTSGTRDLAAQAHPPAGPPAAAEPAAQKPVFPRAPDALERVTWRTRTVVGNERLTHWKFAIASGGAGRASFFDTVVRADAAVVDFRNLSGRP
jgi:hypothetical protein